MNLKLNFSLLTFPNETNTANFLAPQNRHIYKLPPPEELKSRSFHAKKIAVLNFQTLLNAHKLITELISVL